MRNLKKKDHKFDFSGENFEKHNVQKLTLFVFISNSFWDMCNSLNSPYSHVFKITLEIRVISEIKDRSPK